MAASKKTPEKKAKKALPAVKSPAKKTASKASPKTAKTSEPAIKKSAAAPIKSKAPEPKATTPSSNATTNEEDKDTVFVTEEGFKNLKDELEYLKTEKRKELAKRLKEAISYGDLSENSEYEEAKNEQAFIEGRIIELEKKVKHAKIIAGEKAGIVRIGSTVLLFDLQNNIKEEYTIVGSTEADPMAKRISNESPVGRELLGKKKGERITVKAPGGKFEYEILEIK